MEDGDAVKGKENNAAIGKEESRRERERKRKVRRSQIFKKHDFISFNSSSITTIDTNV